MRLFKKNKKEEKIKIYEPKPKISDKFIIDGKMYNVKTSTLICRRVSKENSWKDFGYIPSIDISYYKTAKGNYFAVDKILETAYRIEEEKFKEMLIKWNIDKYIELFGEPEEA